MMNQPFNNNNNMNFNMNNMNVNQAMINMNNLMNTNFNVNQQAQFFNMINSNPMMLMIWNQMLMQNNQNMANMGIMPNMGNMQMPANNQNFPNMQFPKQGNFQININFIDTNWNKTMIQTNPDEYMSSVINKYINKSGDFRMNNMYLFNGKNVVQSLTVAELGVMDGSEVYVVETSRLKGAHQINL